MCVWYWSIGEAAADDADVDVVRGYVALE